jgi:hypothetical protein
MHPLGLSRGVLKDGFPAFLDMFDQPSIMIAMKQGFNISASRWPLKDGHPAIASMKAQVITYSMNHFLVRISPLYRLRIFSCSIRDIFILLY